jgi:hypothetical protein
MTYKLRTPALLPLEPFNAPLILKRQSLDRTHSASQNNNNSTPLPTSRILPDVMLLG